MSSTSPDLRNAPGRTRIIAHRGASGYLPEHTLAAKALAYGLGADFIEQDVVASADGQLVVLHDIYLDDVSDVAEVFAGRERDDGRFYVVDFSLSELRQLSINERRRSGTSEQLYPGRFPYASPGFRIASFEEEVSLIAGLNASTGKHVGIYPEIKDPAWHAEAGIDLTALMHAELERLREQISGPVFVQSFDSDALRRLQDEFASEWPRVQLLNRNNALALLDDAAVLSGIGSYAVGVGLPFATLIEARNGSLQASALALRLREAGLAMHPYTMRRDVAPPDGIDYFGALRFLIRDFEVDALFCDHPDDGIAIRDGTVA